MLSLPLKGEEGGREGGREGGKGMSFKGHLVGGVNVGELDVVLAFKRGGREGGRE